MMSLSGRALAQYVQGPEFNSQDWKKKKTPGKKIVQLLLVILFYCKE